MRTTTIGVIIIGLYLFGISASSQTKPPISLSVEIKNPSVKIGNNIQITALLTNNTDQVFIGARLKEAGDPNFQYMVDVEREDHAAVVKKYAEKVRRHEIKNDPNDFLGSFVPLELQPGETGQDIVYLSNRYEFDKPGKYFVQVEYELPESLGGGVIKSNTITITVTP